MDMAKVLMCEIESKEMKRVIKISMEFTTDAEGDIMLSYCHDIHLLKADLCLKVNIDSENTIKQYQAKEFKPRQFFDRDPAMRSLRSLKPKKKKKKIFMKNG